MARGRGGGVAIPIDGDESGLRTSLLRSERSLARFDSVGTRALGGMRTSAIAATAAVGALTVGAIRFGTSSVKAALEAEAQMARAQRMVEAAGISWRKYGGEIEATLQKQMRLSGFDDEELALSFANIARVTHDHTEALRLNGIAMDLARGKGMELQTASTLVGKVAAGNVSVLGRYGIQLEKGATATEALAALQKQFAGQAETAGRVGQGAIDRMNTGWMNLKETIGGAALPAFTRLTNHITDEVLPKLEGAADDIGKVWASTSLDAGEKWGKTLERIGETGFPDAARDAILDGISYVGTHAPGALLSAMADAPWGAKGAIGLMLLTKFGPGLKMLGTGAGKALGGAGVAGGGLGGVASKAAPVPVWVTNWGGVPGALPPGAGGAGGVAAGAARGTVGRALRLGAIGATVGSLAFPDTAGPREPGEARNLTRELERLDALVKKGAIGFRDYTVLVGRAQRQLGDLAAQVPAAAGPIDRFHQEIAKGGPKTARSFADIRDAAVRNLKGLPDEARLVATDAMLQMAQNLERGGRLPKGATARLVRELESRFGDLPAAARKSVGLVGTAFDELPGRIRRALSAAASSVSSASVGLIAETDALARRLSPLSGFGPLPRRAMGGFIPGNFDAKDDIPIRVSRGEVILNPSQQRLVGIDRIVSALHATGGVVGRDGFATGGFVNPLSPVGRMGGGPGGGTHSRSERGYVWQDDDAYDLHGSDGHRVVAAADGVVGSVSRFNSDPRFWGHGLYLGVPGGQLFYKHLKSVSVRPGQRVSAGQVLGALGAGVNGGPHLHLGASPLSLLSSVVGASAATGGKDDGHGSSDEDRRGRAAAVLARKAISASLGRIGTSSAAPSGLSDRAEGAISEAGREAGREVIRRGGSAAEAAEARDDAQRRAEMAWYKREHEQTVARRAEVNKQIAKARKEAQQLAKKMPRKGPAKAAKEKALAAVRKRMKALLDERAGLTRWLGEIADHLLDLDIAEQQDREDDAQAAIPDALADPGGSTSDPSTPAGPTPDQQAQLDQANARADAAQANFQAGEDFIRTAFGPGDIGQGAGTAWQAAGGTINVNVSTLHPGDPATLQAIIAAVSAAGNMQSGPAAPAIAVGP